MWVGEPNGNLDVRIAHDLDPETGLNDNNATLCYLSMLDSSRAAGQQWLCLCYHLHLLSSQLRKPAAMQKQHTGLLPTSMAPTDIFAELIVSRRLLNSNNVVHRAEPPSATAELIAMIFKTLPEIFPYSISLLSILSKIRGQFFNSFLD